MNRGMTLAETLVVVGIFIIISGAIMAFGADIFSSTSAVSGSLETAYQAQVLLKNILKELRSASPSISGGYPIAQVSSTSISFFVDTNNDGASEKISYYISSSTLYRSIIHPDVPSQSYNPLQAKITTLATNVRNDNDHPIFEYYGDSSQDSGSPMTYPISISEVRMIRVVLSLDVDPKRSPLPITYSINASLRNLKDNL